MNKISASILSANFNYLLHDVQNATEYGADYIHVDIMDNHFVPELTFGPMILNHLKPHTTTLFDVHLMTTNPDSYIPKLTDTAHMISFHIEATNHAHKTLQLIKSYNINAGIALNPQTPIQAIENLLNFEKDDFNLIDYILIMTVNPGAPNQSFINAMIPKIKEIHWKFPNIPLQFDGGINKHTIYKILEITTNPNNIFVAGSAIFNENDLKSNINLLKQAYATDTNED